MNNVSNKGKGQANRKRIELILHQLNSLPTLPAVAAQLLQLTVKSNTQADEVVKLIESDPSLASKIIALATRSNTGIRKETASVSKAVVMLGFDTVRSVVLGVKVFEALGKCSLDSEAVFDRPGFWKHSLAVACASKTLCRYIDRKIDPDEAFICGLLHDLGKLALDTCLPKSFARIVQITESTVANISHVERRILGLDHTIVGKRLAQRWRLPNAIAECLWLHHQDPKTLPDSVEARTLVQVVHLSDILAREQMIGYSGNYTIGDSAVALGKELGCPETAIEETAKELREMITDRAELLGLDDLEPGQLYHEALCDANATLSKLNLKLQLQNKRLQIRSSYFELLGKLGGLLQQCDSTADVCILLATLWQEHTGASACAAYVKNDTASIIEGAILSDTDNQPDIFLVDRANDPDIEGKNEETPTRNSFVVYPTGVQHGWFFEQVGPSFDISSTLVMPLQIGQSLVGELIWQDTRGHGVYDQELKEMQAFSTNAALALKEKQKQEELAVLCEDLAQSSQLLEKSQSELIRKRTMAMVGEMACGAAHEINNPLAVVVGRAQLLANSEQDKERKEMLDTIASQGHQATKIISELLEFATPVPPKPTVVQVSELIDDVVASSQQRCQESSVTISVDLSDDLPDMFIDVQQISAAIIEVVYNAAEAYQEKPGDVQVKAQYNELDDVIVVEVVDKGCGMTGETLAKAFNPFFSGKQAGRKRGIGLSRSVRQIEVNGGNIEITSQHKQGTTARITLPMAKIDSAVAVG